MVGLNASLKYSSPSCSSSDTVHVANTLEKSIKMQIIIVTLSCHTKHETLVIKSSEEQLENHPLERRAGGELWTLWSVRYLP